MDEGIQYPPADIFTQAKKPLRLRQRQFQAAQFVEFRTHAVEQLFARGMVPAIGQRAAEGRHLRAF